MKRFRLLTLLAVSCLFSLGASMLPVYANPIVVPDSSPWAPIADISASETGIAVICAVSLSLSVLLGLYLYSKTRRSKNS